MLLLAVSYALDDSQQLCAQPDAQFEMSFVLLNLQSVVNDVMLAYFEDVRRLTLQRNATMFTSGPLISRWGSPG